MKLISRMEENYARNNGANKQPTNQLHMPEIIAVWFEFREKKNWLMREFACAWSRKEIRMFRVELQGRKKLRDFGVEKNSQLWIDGYFKIIDKECVFMKAKTRSVERLDDVFFLLI